jgi:hypothetical protein
MANKIYDICVVKGSYERDGKLKKTYQNVGSVWSGNNGPFVLLDPLVNLASLPRPEGRNMVIASLFKPKPPTTRGENLFSRNENPFGSTPDSDFEDIPF